MKKISSRSAIVVPHCCRSSRYFIHYRRSSFFRQPHYSGFPALMLYFTISVAYLTCKRSIPVVLFFLVFHNHQAVCNSIDHYLFIMSFAEYSGDYGSEWEETSKCWKWNSMSKVTVSIVLCRYVPYDAWLTE